MFLGYQWMYVNVCVTVLAAGTTEPPGGVFDVSVLSSEQNHAGRLAIKLNGSSLEALTPSIRPDRDRPRKNRDFPTPDHWLALTKRFSSYERNLMILYSFLFNAQFAMSSSPFLHTHTHPITPVRRDLSITPRQRRGLTNSVFWLACHLSLSQHRNTTSRSAYNYFFNPFSVTGLQQH